MNEIDYFDLASVERQFETLATDLERVSFCQSIIDYMETEPGAIYQRRDYLVGDDDDITQFLMTPKQQKADKVLRFVHAKKQRSERAILREAQTMQIPETVQLHEDEPDDSAPGQWTTEQIAVALYALLRAAGLPGNHNRSSVARLAHLLSGRSQEKLRKVGYDATGGTYKDEPAREIVEMFEQLGLEKLAQAVRGKDFSKL